MSFVDLGLFKIMDMSQYIFLQQSTVPTDLCWIRVSIGKRIIFGMWLVSSWAWFIEKGVSKVQEILNYTTLTNFSMKYLMMYKVYTDVGGIK